MHIQIHRVYKSNWAANTRNGSKDQLIQYLKRIGSDLNGIKWMVVTVLASRLREQVKVGIKNTKYGNDLCSQKSLELFLEIVGYQLSTY